ncbi:guanylate kinase [bacterium]|nr:guanylate kinase [bacterium]
MEFPKSKLIVISAPSGSGKTSIFKKAKAVLPNLVFSISYTTRQPRAGEINGVDYFFTDEHQFRKMIDGDQLLEWAEVYGNFYGTSKEFIERSQREGKIVVLDIDVQGAMQLKQLPDLDAIFVFFMPPSLEELSKRLVLRGTEDDASLRKRIDNAEHEMSFKDEYDYQIVNDQLEDAVDAFLKVIIYECHGLKSDEKNDMDDIVNSLKKAQIR